MKMKFFITVGAIVCLLTQIACSESVGRGAGGTAVGDLCAQATPAAFAQSCDPTDVPELTRWYSAASYLPIADGTVVGLNGVSPWLDFGAAATPYNAYALTGREPRIKTTLFPQPVIEICGISGGCTGTVAMNTHMRTAPSFTEYADNDLTLFVVAARANGNRNYLLSNQSIGNNTGTFLGWVSGTVMRFGLAGPGGTPAITATVPDYGGTPTLEVWTARLNTGGDTYQPGMSLYLNGVLVGSDANVTQKPAAVTTIPYIGTQRSDHNNAHFYVADWVYFKRALPQTELEKIHAYLVK
jgi:hypothetical protein